MSGNTCATCIHDGCCVDLHYCGGLRWRPAYAECARCGMERHVEDMVEVNGIHYCEDCAVEAESEAEEEVRDGE